MFDKYFEKRKLIKELDKQMKEEKEIKKQEIIDNFTNKFSSSYNKDQLQGIIDGEINILERGLGARKRIPLRRLSYVFKKPKKFEHYLKSYNDIYTKHRKAVDTQLKHHVLKNKFDKEFEMQQQQQMEQKQKLDDQHQEQLKQINEKSEKRIQEQEQKLQDKKDEIEQIKQSNEVKQQQKQQFLEEQKQIQEKHQQELEEVKRQEQERLEQLKEMEQELVHPEAKEQEEPEEYLEPDEEERLRDLEEFHEQVGAEQDSHDYDDFEQKGD